MGRRWGNTPPGVDKQTEISTFPNPSDVGGKHYLPYVLRTRAVIIILCFVAIVKADSIKDSRRETAKGESPRSINRGLDLNDPELHKRIRYTREKKEQLKALLGTSRQVPQDAVIVTTYTTVRPSNDSAATDISEGASSQSHLIKPSDSSSLPCLTNYPYKPARCKSYIVETDPETPLLRPSSNASKDSALKRPDCKKVKKTEDLGRVKNIRRVEEEV